MKLRKRLSKDQAIFLGLKPKKKTNYGNAQYCLTQDQYSRLNEYKKSKRTEKPKHAKILVFDIETAPNKAWVWGKWKQNINDDAYTSDWFILTWSAKWLFDDKVYSAKLTSKEAKNQDDYRICKSLFRMIDEADILIGHNIKKFDCKKINTRFLLHELGSPSSYLMIDTLQHARKQFSFNSNKLDYIAQQLGVGKKVEHSGFKMWLECLDGNEEALNQMQKYNDGDIMINEEVYIKLRPFIKPHPNVALFVDTNTFICPTCESKHIKPVSEYSTYANIYTEFKCDDCGNTCRANKKHTKLTPLPR